VETAEIETPGRPEVRASPVHSHCCDANVWWSTVNASEAMPGVVTPLSWSFFSDALERAMKGTFYDMGVMTRREVIASPRVEERLLGFFYGRAAGNLTVFRHIGDCTPGTSGNAIEEQIFGQVREGINSAPVHRRYPFVVARAPWAAARGVRRVVAAAAPITPWWQHAVAPGAIDSSVTARSALREAAERFERVMRPHTLIAMLCQGMYDQLRAIAQGAGHPGLELTLATGYGNMAETGVVCDLWEVSRGRVTLDQFIHRHGFHGPGEGEIASKVWRIRRDPIEGLIECYGEMGEDRDPRAVERQRASERERAEAQLLGSLRGPRRAQAALVLRLAARFIPHRGTGKAAFLRCIDVGRAAACVIGEDLARAGILEDPEHVFMLTVPELLADNASVDISALAGARLADQATFETLDVSPLFAGVPAPIAIAGDDGSESHDGVVVTGAAVSAGIVEGLARVVLTPGADESFEPGEILVCRTTDPSWASIMMLAAALVIDIGGPISHGAIVARELGIPCVIGTRDGTTRIRTGDLLRVDATTGHVQVLGS
jgi:phosphohistidine swiveling domain-containing protein